MDGRSIDHDDDRVTERLAHAWHGREAATMEHEESLLRELYEHHAGPLLGFVLRLTNGDRLRAEDIVQETILRAWRNAHLLTAQGGRSLRPWLVTVARRIAIDGFRVDAGYTREVYDHDLDDTAGTNPGADDPDRIVESVAMNDALQALTHAHREILVETYFNGRTVAEAAHTLGIPLGTAKSRVHHALRSLRDALERRGLVQHGD
jgi:RNA polymerase sigma-70 factor, ECF subfamily